MTQNMETDQDVIGRRVAERRCVLAMKALLDAAELAHEISVKAFDVEAAELLASRRHGNEARWAAIYLARLVTDETVGAIGEYFGGVSEPTISKTVARVEARRREDRGWDRRLARLAGRLTACGDPAQIS
ncbi:MAG: hypothetical protein A2V70_14785 [Planctomycetes bacterium RBG_13_63_9]|nr:MAG: hypothetical protein A2V70_14785 [Planctomycetes bacterium RBG_13_63_9]